jgi:hypothetical protein
VLVLGVLLAVLAVVVAYAARRSASDPGVPSNQVGPGAARPSGPARGTAGAAAQGPELDVKLDALQAARPEPADSNRNPFRFQPKAPPPPPPGSSRGAGVTAPQPEFKPTQVAPPPPPPPPPIPLHFIGTLESERLGKIAILSDCKAVVHGAEGQVVDGRYRVLKIGVQSITMGHLDGRGQQVIPLNGQACVGRR